MKSIIELAREAAMGMLSYDAEGTWHLTEAEVERFTILVAAAEREALRKLEERAQRDEALLRQALEALLDQRGEPDWRTGKQRENAIAALRERLGVSNG